MASYLNAADVISTAVEIEKRGHQFYVQASTQATSDRDKEFFAFMAKEESRHEAIFTDMLKRVGGTEIPASATDDEYFDYVHNLIDSHCLFMDDQQEAIKTNPFKQAMQFEKDTILFFQAVEPLVPQSEQQFIRQCIDEERSHLLLIAKHMKAQ